MLKSVLWYIDLAASLIYKEVAGVKIKKLQKADKKAEIEDLVYKEVSTWGKKRLVRTGSNITVHGIENLPLDRTVLFVSNHQSDFDIPLLLGYIPVPKGFIAKKELGKVPFLTKWMKRIHCLFMDRDDLKQSMQVILEGIKILKNGYSMVIFPEGTRSKDGVLGEFKAGSFKLALKSKVAIVPITINGTRNVLEANNYKIKPAEVSLFIHEPIETTTLTKDEITELPERVKQIIQKDLSN